MRIGMGYDVHRLVENRKLIIGGVTIPYDKGLLGHSDADVLIHALMDGILGAMGLRDIGFHFPDTDQAYKDIDSKILLARVKSLMDKEGYTFVNGDCTVVAQEPKLSPYIPEMQKVLSEIIDCSPSQINIKATTTETLGFEGRKEGISAYAVCLLS